MNKTQIVTEQRNGQKQDMARLLRREQTDAEKTLWARLRRGQVNGLHFRWQQVIDGFIVDFYCHAEGLTVEADGSVHEQNREPDTVRDAALRARGLTVLHFTNNRIATELDMVVGELTPTLYTKYRSHEQRKRHSHPLPSDKGAF